MALSAILITACSPIGLINTLSPSDHYEASRSHAYGNHIRQSVDVYTPRGKVGRSPLVVFFYGGGWREGRKEDYEFVAASLTEAGYVVAIPDYRLFPEVVFPDFVEDGAAAIAWAHEHSSDFGANPDELYLVGHSAGAHIAALLSLDSSYLARHDLNTNVLKGLVGLSGPFDFLPIDSGYLLDVFPEETRQDSQPINFVSDSAPPTLLIHGADDEVVEPGNSERLAMRFKESDLPVTLKLYDGTGHARVAAGLAPPLDFVADTLDDTKAFLAYQSSRVAGRR